MLRDRLPRSTGRLLVTMIMRIGETGATELADDVYAHTRAGRWMIRVAAMIALDKLQDSRRTEALARNAADVSRGPRGLDWLDVTSSLERRYFQMELIRAVKRNEVHVAEESLASLANDGWSGDSMARVFAGDALGVLNRPQALVLTRRLLKSWSATEQKVGVMIAEYARLTELRDEVERIEKSGGSGEVRRMAARLLDDWGA
jgi:hypothetical protein